MMPSCARLLSRVARGAGECLLPRPGLAFLGLLRSRPRRGTKFSKFNQSGEGG